MTNLAPVLAQLQDALAMNGEPARTWKTGALIILKMDEKGSDTAYIKVENVEEIISFEDIELLEKADMLVEDGKLQRVRIGTKQGKALGIHFTKLKRAVAKAQSESSATVLLEQKVKRLERELRLKDVGGGADEAMRQLIQETQFAVAGKRFNLERPFKFNRTKPVAGKTMAGIPTLFLSDWHWGETVDPAQINYLNEFDLDIARARASRVFDATLELLFHHQSGQSYEGITIALGGDMFSGNIHEELRRSNGAPILECVMDLAQVLTTHIVEVSRQFAQVYVPCVVGNHGRIDRKPSAKNAVKDNFDWMLYHLTMAMVQGKLGDECNVDFDISTSLDMRFDLYNTKYLLTHGDQISGGTGQGGIWPSVLQTAKKKLARETAAGGKGFDYMMCGHFHTYGAVSNIIVNGSLKGYDEWTYRMNFEAEQPVQSLWTTHPEYGIIDRRPVFANVLAARDMSTYGEPIRRYRQGLQAPQR